MPPCLITLYLLMSHFLVASPATQKCIISVTWTPQTNCIIARLRHSFLNRLLLTSCCKAGQWLSLADCGHAYNPSRPKRHTALSHYCCIAGFDHTEIAQEDANIRIPRLTHTHPSSISKHPLSVHYPLELIDQGENLRGTSFNITVSWNIMPTVGKIEQTLSMQVQRSMRTWHVSNLGLGGSSCD